MQLTGPDHLVLVSPDVERLVAWYCDELGLAPERLEEWAEVFEGTVTDLYVPRK